MKLTLTISMDNAAFEDMPGVELARILRTVARQIEGSEHGDSGKFPVLDINGNNVGSVIVSQ